MEIPDELAGVWIERQRAVEIKAVVRDAGLVNRVKERAGVVRLPDSEVGEVELRIVTAGGPDRATVAPLKRKVVPSVAAALAGTRNRVEAPCFLAEAIQATGFEETKVLSEATFPTELLANDPTAREVAKNLKLSREKAKDLASSVVSIKVSAIKPSVS